MVDVSEASGGVITVRCQSQVTVGPSAELRESFHATRVWDGIAAIPPTKLATAMWAHWTKDGWALAMLN